MVLFDNSLEWKTLLVSVSLKELPTLATQVEKSLQEQIGDDPKELKKWSKINIMSSQIISSTYQPSKDTTIVDLLVVVNRV